MLDREGYLYAGYETTLFKFGDQGDATAISPLELVGSIDVREELPPEAREGVTRFMGVNMTFDGEIVVALPGVIAAVDRGLSTVYAVPIPGEAVDNGIAVADGGGVYVVTSKYMRKVVWTGSKLSADEADGAWHEPYDYDADKPGFWLSRGSGATPVVMGFGQDDQLVLIPDAGDPVKLVAYWQRDSRGRTTGGRRRFAAGCRGRAPGLSGRDHGRVVTARVRRRGDGDGLRLPRPRGRRRLQPLHHRHHHGLHPPGASRRPEVPLGSDNPHSRQAVAVTWTLSPICTPNHAVYLNTLESGDWRIIGPTGTPAIMSPRSSSDRRTSTTAPAVSSGHSRPVTSSWAACSGPSS